MRINVLYQSDSNYAVYMGVSIYSLLTNNTRNDITIYVIDDDIDEQNKDVLREMTESFGQKICFVPYNAILQDEAISQAFSYTGFRKNKHSYFKLFFDHIITDDLDRLIYIDCDTVIEGDLSGLAGFDMGSRPLGMVLDALVVDSRTSVGLNADDSYYNSGVIMINVPEWKKRNCSERIISHAANVRQYGTVDQDILNVEFRNEIVTLPAKYNLQPAHIDLPYANYSAIFRHRDKYYEEAEINDAAKDPTIVHFLRFLGESPWDAGNCHPSARFYDRYFLESPWKSVVRKRKEVKPIFRIEKAMYKLFPKTIFWRIFYYVHENMIRKSNRTND